MKRKRSSDGKKLTGKEVVLAIALAVMGFFFTLRPFLLFMSTLNPLFGFAIYEAILFGTLVVLSRLDLVILGIRIKDISQTIGLFLITFAFFITVDLTSAYVQYVTAGSFSGMSPVYLQSEDGVTFWFFQKLLPWASAETWRILTYVVTPFLLGLIGGVLASGKAKVGR